MILVTGATGFVGSALVRHLDYLGLPVRVLLHPSPYSPRLPRGMKFNVTVCSFDDLRGLQGSLKNVKTIFHLASAEHSGEAPDFEDVDIIGTERLLDAARRSGVERFIFLSHLGADRNSSFPVFKAKALAEYAIQHSSINYSIFRSSVIFGPNDHFTIRILHILSKFWFFFPLPGNGQMILQPLWIQDLITCLILAIENESTFRNILYIGGGEYFSFKEIVKIILRVTGRRRLLIPITSAYLRTLNLWLGRSGRGFPFSNTWLDYLASDRTCSLDVLPKLFGLLPARFEKHLSYLKPHD